MSAAYLDCPACLGDGIQATGTYCPECGREGTRHVTFGCEATPFPGWTEADGGPCVTCGTALRVVVDDGVAYCEEAAQ